MDFTRRYACSPFKLSHYYASSEHSAPGALRIHYSTPHVDYTSAAFGMKFSIHIYRSYLLRPSHLDREYFTWLNMLLYSAVLDRIGRKAGLELQGVGGWRGCIG